MKNKLNWSLGKNLLFFCVPLIMWCVSAVLRTEVQENFAAQGNHGDVLMLGTAIGACGLKIGAVVLLLLHIMRLCDLFAGTKKIGGE